MTSLAEQTGAGDTSLIPGYTLSPLDLLDFGELETHFNREHLRTAGSAAESLPEAIVDKLLRNAQDDINAGKFRYGEPAFDVKLLGNESLLMMLHQSLRKTQADLTVGQVRPLFTIKNQNDVKKLLLEYAGFMFRKKGVASVSEPAQPIGRKSSTLSDASTATDAPDSLPPSAAA